MAPRTRGFRLATRLQNLLFLVLLHAGCSQVPLQSMSASSELLNAVRENGRKSEFAANDFLGERHHHPPVSSMDGLSDMHQRLLNLLAEDTYTAPSTWDDDVSHLQKRVIEMFYHAYDSYMMYAFPHDELLPLSCHLSLIHI